MIPVVVLFERLREDTMARKISMWTLGITWFNTLISYKMWSDLHVSQQKPIEISSLYDLVDQSHIYVDVESKNEFLFLPAECENNRPAQ